MKPLQTKKPMECCGASILVWEAKRLNYVCPCGASRTTMDGVPMRKNGRVGITAFGNKKRR